MRADPGDKNRHRSSYWKTLQRPKHQSCNKPRETGKARQEELRGPSLLRWLLLLDHYRPLPKGKLWRKRSSGLFCTPCVFNIYLNRIWHWTICNVWYDIKPNQLTKNCFWHLNCKLMLIVWNGTVFTFYWM